MSRFKTNTVTWGNAQEYVIGQPGAAGPGKTGNLIQLLQVGYNPPQATSWKWIFTAGPVTTNLPVAPPTAWTLDVYWDIYVGLGRTVTQLTGFEHYHFRGADLAAGHDTCFSSSVNAPVRDTSVAAPPTNIIDTLVAETILVNVRFTNSLPFPIPNFELHCPVSAYFAPVAHVPLREFEALQTGEASKEDQLRELFDSTQTPEDYVGPNEDDEPMPVEEFLEQFNGRR